MDRKASTLIVPTLMIGLIPIIIFSSYIIFKSTLEENDLQIGVNALETIERLSENEYAFLYLDHTAQTAAKQSQYDLAQLGGLGNKNVCTFYYHTVLWNLSRNECVPLVDNQKAGYKSLFEDHLQRLIKNSNYQLDAYSPYLISSYVDGGEREIIGRGLYDQKTN